ncbi:MAG TPA: c-type cytochrome [Acidimicrobiales bacterium]
MTEIPEHLLRRSRERRAALGLGGGAPAGESGESGGAGGSEPAPAAASEAPTPAPAPTPAAPAEEPKPEPPKPEPVYIQAAKRRRRVPYWAASVLAALPLWAYVYVRTLEPPPEGEDDPVALGQAAYSQCSSCHGGQGEGGAGPAFADGAVQATWPDWRDHMMWVRLGSEGWPGSTYGAQETPKGGGMPAWALTDQELAQVVIYERILGGEDITEDNPDYADLFAIARGELTFADVGLGPLSEEAGVPEDRLAG